MKTNPDICDTLDEACVDVPYTFHPRERADDPCDDYWDELAESN